MTGMEKGILQNNPGKLSLKWKIDRFFADCHENGDYYTSPRFPIEYANKTAKGYLKVYPHGDVHVPNKVVSLYLCFERKLGVSGEYRLAIVDSKTNSAPSNCKAGGKFNDQSEILGYAKFVDRYSLNPSEGTLINDSLTILCDIDVHAPCQNNVTGSSRGYAMCSDKIENHPGDFEDLLESGNFTDVTFNLHDKTINVHKAILSCRSPVFKAMFEHEMRENRQNVVDVTDIDHDVMKELFRFMYSGQVKNIKKIAGDLLIAADKYQVIKLKTMCEKVLYDSVTIDNAVEILKLTELCDTIHLKRLVVKFVADHYKDVDKMSGLVDLNSNVMYQIIQAIAKQG